MGRPIKQIDLELLNDLAKIQCTYDEMAAILKVDKSTLLRRYATEITKGREEGKRSLRRKMFETAMQGNVTMMIWLSKQYLDHKDKVETEQKQEITISHTDEEKQAMKEQLKALMQVPK